jgi:hypothetical protein
MHEQLRFRAQTRGEEAGIYDLHVCNPIMPSSHANSTAAAFKLILDPRLVTQLWRLKERFTNVADPRVRGRWPTRVPA